MKNIEKIIAAILIVIQLTSCVTNYTENEKDSEWNIIKSIIIYHYYIYNFLKRVVLINFQQ